MALAEPHALWDVGFQLSFAATLGLVLYADPLTGALTRLASRYLPESAVQRLAGPVALCPPSSITILSTRGHTPGHISLLISGDNERLYLLGDVLLGAMQIEEPDWSVALDNDPALARQSRERLYPELVKPNTMSLLTLSKTRACLQTHKRSGIMRRHEPRRLNE